MVKKLLLATILSLAVQASTAQVEIVREIIRKMILQIDLAVQRLQNNTIWLQNAQKAVENTLSKLRLEEISHWIEKHRQLYEEYFEELWKVKAALTQYHRVKNILETQLAMVNEYRQAWSLFRQDKNFTEEERAYMFRVYTGLLEQTLQQTEQLQLVVRAFATQMSDARRLEIIHHCADRVQALFMDLKQFNQQNKTISLQRAAEKGELEYVKKLYGL